MIRRWNAAGQGGQRALNLTAARDLFEVGGSFSRQRKSWPRVDLAVACQGRSYPGIKIHVTVPYFTPRRRSLSPVYGVLSSVTTVARVSWTAIAAFSTSVRSGMSFSVW